MTRNENDPFKKWDLKTTRTFDELLTSYQHLPNSEKMVSSMIKFNEMYQPLLGMPFRIDPFGFIRGENEYREIKRAQLYLAKKDLISVTGKYGSKRLILTSKAHRVFYKEFPLSKLREKKWNGYWTIVMYDFPEKLRNKRNNLRKKLIEIGFGSPQESVIITPLPLDAPTQEFIEGEDNENFAWVLTAKRVLGMTNREVAIKAWDLDRLNSLYKELFESIQLIKGLNNKDLQTKWGEYFLALENTDPYLPFELLPNEWYGEKCRKEFNKTIGLKELLKSLFR